MLLKYCDNNTPVHPSGAPKEKILAKYLNIISFFLTLFQSFLKEYLCRLTQIDLFGFLSSKFRLQKILGNRIPSAEFPSC